jgi:hypothetical protein
MANRLYKPYRGYQIEVRVTPGNSSVAFTGVERRYAVGWFIFSMKSLGASIASFPERIDFVTETDAFRYGEQKAHAFIDGTMNRASS